MAMCCVCQLWFHEHTCLDAAERGRLRAGGKELPFKCRDCVDKPVAAVITAVEDDDSVSPRRLTSLATFRDLREAARTCRSIASTVLSRHVDACRELQTVDGEKLAVSLQGRGWNQAAFAAAYVTPQRGVTDGSLKHGRLQHQLTTVLSVLQDQLHHIDQDDDPCMQDADLIQIANHHSLSRRYASLIVTATTMSHPFWETTFVLRAIDAHCKDVSRLTNVYSALSVGQSSLPNAGSELAVSEFAGTSAADEWGGPFKGLEPAWDLDMICGKGPGSMHGTMRAIQDAVKVRQHCARTLRQIARARSSARRRWKAVLNADPTVAEPARPTDDDQAGQLCDVEAIEAVLRKVRIMVSPRRLSPAGLLAVFGPRLASTGSKKAASLEEYVTDLVPRWLHVPEYAQLTEVAATLREWEHRVESTILPATEQFAASSIQWHVLDGMRRFPANRRLNVSNVAADFTRMGKVVSSLGKVARHLAVLLTAEQEDGPELGSDFAENLPNDSSIRLGRLSVAMLAPFYAGICELLGYKSQASDQLNSFVKQLDDWTAAARALDPLLTDTFVDSFTHGQTATSPHDPVVDTTELQYIAPGSHRHGIYATNDNDTPTLIAERFATSHDLTVKIFLSLNQHFLPDLRSMSKFRPLTRVFLTAAAAASAVSTGADAMAAYVTATDVYADPVMLLREPPLVTSEAFFTPLDTLFRECEVLKLHHLNIRNQSTPAPPAGATVDTWSLSASKHQSTCLLYTSPSPRDRG